MKKILLIIIIFTAAVIRANEGYHFIKNDGQWTNNILYKANIYSGALFLEKNTITYNFYNDNYQYNHTNIHTSKNNNLEKHLRFHAFKVKFINASENPSIIPSNKCSQYYNFYYGRKNHHNLVYAYNKIDYKNIYNNIDFSIYSNNENFKYDLILSPGSNPKDIKLVYEGVDNMEVDPNGNLLIKTSVNQIIEQKPYAYQIIDGEKIEIPCNFKIRDNTISFNLKKYNTAHTLVIDPVLIFGSYSGSTANNFGMTATYGYDGSLFAGGTAFNIGYPTTTGAYDSTFANTPAAGITDVVITGYDSTGTNLIYSTYIGGNGTETVHSLIANEQNELFLYGVTSSSDFPVTNNAYDTSFAGGNSIYWMNNGTNFQGGMDIYISKFNSTGTALLASTYIGGSSNDGVNYTVNNAYDSLLNNYGDQFRGEIMIDDTNNVYIATSTKSSDFPIVNGFDNSLGGHQDGVAFKLSPNFSNLLWSTYIGGSYMDAAYSIKVDSIGNTYVSGGTSSNDFTSTPGTINPVYLGGIADGYLCKISPNGSNLLSATFIGTNSYDQAYFVELDRFENVYVVGQTKGNFPILNANYSNANSSNFVMRLNNTFSNIDYSTIFGNGNINSDFSPSAFLVDRCENIYVSGWGGNILGGGQLTNMPTTSNAFQPNSGDGYNFYLIVLERNANSLLYGTYFGGNQSQEHVDGGTSRFDKNGIVYQSVCAGCQNNDDFPTTQNAWSNTNNSSGCNNGVFKFDFEIIPQAEFSVDNFQGCAPLTVTFNNSSGQTDSYLWDFGGGDTTSTIFNPVKTYNTPGTYLVTLAITDSICNTTDTAYQYITVSPMVTVDAGLDITTCDTATLKASSTGGATTFIWSSTNQHNDTLNMNTSDSTLFVTVGDTTVYYIKAGNGTCWAYDSVFVYYVGVDINTINGSTCLGDTAVVQVIDLNNHNLTYNWSPTSIILSGGNTCCPVLDPDTTTTMYVTVQNQYGCIASDSAIVYTNGFDPNNINVWADDDTLYNGNGTYLHVEPSSGFTYLWLPPFWLNNPTSPNPYAEPPTTTTYTVELTDSNGCKYTKQYTIYAWEVICGEPEVFIPNAFTPNGDNENDVLYVRGRNVEKMNLSIYNRWGEKVFESNNQQVGWDGIYKGDFVEPGVFVYHLTVKCVDGQDYFKKGNVTVIR